MIIQLTPEQITEYWAQIKHVILETQTAVNLRGVNNVLLRLMSGEYVVWVGVDDQRQITAIALTMMYEDRISEEKILELSAVYAFRKMPVELRQEAMKLFEKYANNCGCTKIRAVTQNPRAIQLMEEIGFTNKSCVYTWEVQPWVEVAAEEVVEEVPKKFATLLS